MGADAGGEFFRRRRRRRRRRHWTPWRGFIENVLFSKKKSIFWTHIVFPWNNMTPKSRNINPIGIYFLGFVDLHNLV